MASYHCDICTISYPPHAEYATCPVDFTATQYSTWALADNDWRTRMEAAQAARARKDAPAELIPIVHGKVRSRGDDLVVWAWDVFPAVRRRLEPGELIQIGQQTFEIQEYLHEPREYRVKSFSTALSDEDLRRLADGG